MEKACNHISLTAICYSPCNTSQNLECPVLGRVYEGGNSTTTNEIYNPITSTELMLYIVGKEVVKMMPLADVTLIDELRMFMEDYNTWYITISKFYFCTIVLWILGLIAKERVKKGPHDPSYIFLKKNAIRTIFGSTVIYVSFWILFTASGSAAILYQKYMYDHIKENMTISEAINILGDPAVDVKENTFNSIIGRANTAIGDFSSYVQTELQGGEYAAQATKENEERKERYKTLRWTSNVLKTYITITFYREKVSSKSRLGPSMFLANDDFGYRNTEAAEDKAKQKEARFIKNPNGVIVDRKTNLKWIEEPTGKYFTWTNAKKWAESLTVDNGGWTLPTLKELATLYMSGVVDGYCGKNKYTFYVDGKIFSNRCWTLWAVDSNSSQAAYFNYGFADPFLNSIPRIDFSAEQYSGWVSKNTVANRAVAVKKTN